MRVVSLRPQDLDRRRASRTGTRCGTFVRCYKSRHWPGPGGDRRMAEEIWMPDWHRDSVKARLANLAEEEASMHDRRTEKANR